MFWDMPPTCAIAGTTNSPAGARFCTTTPTLRLIAYDLADPGLHACHHAPVCEQHAPTLAAHWRRHGVRVRQCTRPRRVLTDTQPWQRAAVNVYSDHLAPFLPGMPPTPPRADPERHPAAHLHLRRLIEPGPATEARLDVQVSDRGRFGKARREMTRRLALALDCDPHPAMSIHGPWRDRLDLVIYGPYANVRALAKSLNPTLGIAEQHAARDVRSYGAWLKRTTGDTYDAAAAPAMRRAWRTTYLTAYAQRWTQHITAAYRGQDAALFRYIRPTLDDPAFSPYDAAYAAADDRWHRLQELRGFRIENLQAEYEYQAAAAREMGRPLPEPPELPPTRGLLISRGVELPPRPSGAPKLPPPLVDEPEPEPARTLPLFTPPPDQPEPPAPEPEIPPYEGRPLLEILTEYVVQ